MLIRSANPEDSAAIVALLAAAELRTEDVLAPGVNFWIAQEDQTYLGCIGLEQPATANGCALLRSTCVRSEARGARLGEQLTDAVCAYARAHGITRLYCYSTDAGAYWRARGFVECPVSELLAVLADVPQSQLFERLGWLPTEIAWQRVLA